MSTDAKQPTVEELASILNDAVFDTPLHARYPGQREEYMKEAAAVLERYTLTLTPRVDPAVEELARALYAAPWDTCDDASRKFWREIATNLLRTHTVTLRGVK